MLIYYACAVVTAASAFTSLGFSIGAYRNAANSAHNSDMYALSRSSALALVSLLPLTYHSVDVLSAIAIVMIAVQAFDAIIGIKLKDSLKTYGPAMTSLLNLGALVWLSTSTILKQ